MYFYCIPQETQTCNGQPNFILIGHFVQAILNYTLDIHQGMSFKTSIYSMISLANKCIGKISIADDL